MTLKINSFCSATEPNKNIKKSPADLVVLMQMIQFPDLNHFTIHRMTSLHA